MDNPKCPECGSDSTFYTQQIEPSEEAIIIINYYTCNNEACKNHQPPNVACSGLETGAAESGPVK